ncbi:MAG TPA: phosphoglucomutase/phosphomannomutase family protein [Bacteroidia bacterium]|jgi:phosphomannomutase|nr:phosphoglucomutase/phosphomannomutase family protein [Bacteroidia bacterium]HQF28804.1 phosphoglucomutase/phosphomannomutase family protein [Bacteroidia bacterium]
MTKIKFGTDGWRAIIAQDFTVENVARVAEGTAKWLLQSKPNPTIVLGHDCRFAGALFCDTIAKVMCSMGVKVSMSKGFVSTPMISLGAVRLKKDLGIIITASHNPPEYNGFKLKGHYGGPLLPSHVAEIEDLIPEKCTVNHAAMDIEQFEKSGMLDGIDLETMYCDHVKANFDLDAIRNSGLKLAYDAMYGAGQNVIKRLLPEITMLHCDYNPSFMGQAPEPIHKNLTEFSNLIKNAGNIDSGLVTDGDADRIGFYDGKGNFVDSHHIILLLIHYLHKYKGQTGKVCTAFSTTPKVEKLCKFYGIEIETVKIGFKYIAEIMIKEDVLLGGEESGGIAIKGHIPERDGIWMGLTIWEFMAKSGKTLDDLINEVYEIVGPFSFERNDLHLKEEVKQRILQNCIGGKYTHFGKYKIARTEDLDGYKYFFENGDWLMIRASGTEPVLRTYAESSTKEAAFDILNAAKADLLN